MRDLVVTEKRPIGYFVHHQGRGHAERCAAIVNALPDAQPAVIFCARDDIFPLLAPHVSIRRIPSLFERQGDEAEGADIVGTPATVHCAPLGWPGVRTAMGVLAEWFREANPLLMVCDVSAEVAQLCRLCSVPHVKVLQHGARADAAHAAAYAGAVGLLAPSHEALAQPDWTADMRGKTFFAAGIGAPPPMDRAEARATLGVGETERIAVVVSGGGGHGAPQAPIGIAARTFPGMTWWSIGAVQRDWHATEPANVRHHGWVDDPRPYFAAADLLVTSAGNTTCHHALATGVPWIVIPEWRYFDEQVHKADAIGRAEVAAVCPHFPSSADAWRDAIDRAVSRNEPARARELANGASAADVATWLLECAAKVWGAEALHSSVQEAAHV